MGVFDEQMSVYLLYKQREFAKMGFSGFEGRHYSLFQSFSGDMGRAADLQTLITALAYKYMAQGVDHRSIPDDPTLESERRQVFFGAAIGLPTFFVRKDTANSFLQRIISKTQGIRPSKRYPSYLRVQIHEYRLALLRTLREDGADLIELMGLQETMHDLEQRIREPEQYAASGRLTGGILEQLGSRSALKTEARDFNTGAEEYYRTTLRKEQMAEAFDLLQGECCRLDQQAAELDEPLRKALLLTLQGQSADQFMTLIRQDILQEQAAIPTLQRLMNLLLVKVHHDQQQTMAGRSELDAAPVYRAG